MYNGLFSDTSDNIGVLQEQIDLIAGLNAQLKEFSSLKSNISGVFEIIKLGGEKTKEAANAGRELSAASKLNTDLIGALSSSTDQLASSTNTASTAEKTFSSIMNVSAIQITAVIVAVTAVVAAITTFVKWINRTNEAGEAAKTSAENLVAAQEELSQSAIDSSAAYITGSFYK